MAYADQQMSGNRLTALIIVALIHVAVGYALITGLAYEGVKAVIKKVTTVDIKDEPKPPPPPPPPPKNAPPPPPIVAPPPPINIAPAPPAIVTAPVAPPPAPVLAPPAPVAPPPPKFTPKGPAPKNDQTTWVTTDDYPSRPLHDKVGGTTSFRLTVGPDGRVTGCEITGSSGNQDLDNAACTYASRRARFKPATDGDGNPAAGSYPSRVRWVIPKD